MSGEKQNSPCIILKSFDDKRTNFAMRIVPPWLACAVVPIHVVIAGSMDARVALALVDVSSHIVSMCGGCDCCQLTDLAMSTVPARVAVRAVVAVDVVVAGSSVLTGVGIALVNI